MGFQNGTAGLLRLALVFALCGIGSAQTLTLSSGSAAPGLPVSLSLSLNSAAPQPAATQWALSYSAADFSAITVTASNAVTAAGKSISCNSTAGNPTCVLWGMNTNAIPNGVIATIVLTVSATTHNTSSLVQVGAAASASPAGLSMATIASGATVTIVQPAVTVTGINCNPGTVSPPSGSTCQVTLSAAAPAGGVSVTLGTNSGNVIQPAILPVPAAATSASFSLTTTSVNANTVAQITASLGTSSASFPLQLLGSVSNGVAPDVTISQDSPGGATVTSPTFSTAAGNELLLAFISTGGAAPVTVNSVTGAGLTWALAVRTNGQKGTAEIWRAFSPSTLSSVAVQASLSSSVASSMTVMSFTGVDPSGASGSGAIGAIATANAVSGAPSASLTTTRDSSWVIGVGNDATAIAARAPGASQTLVHQDTPTGNTFWVQERISPTPLSGTAVAINDTAPTADPYNLSAVEILPPNSCAAAMVPGNRSFPVGGASSLVNVATGPGCTWTVTTDSPSWITLSGGSGTGNGTFSYSTTSNVGQTRMGTVSIGATSFKVMQSGPTQIFTDVFPSTAYFDYISLMFQNGVTAGCQASPLLYCPSTPVTRAQMATFVVSALQHINHAAGGLPVGYTLTPYFQDVPASNPLFPFVQALADSGITNGCQASPPLFCPNTTITQGQMAKFMIIGWMRANNLSSFTYSQTPYFTDVPPSDMFFSYIQKMMDLQIWTGCGASLYCESNTVSRSDMAPMVMRSLLGAP